MPSGRVLSCNAFNLELVLCFDVDVNQIALWYCVSVFVVITYLQDQIITDHYDPVLASSASLHGVLFFSCWLDFSV